MSGLTELEKFYMCTDSIVENGIHSIECRLGLWSVSLANGEYSSIIGGMNVVETLLHNKGIK